MSIEQEHPDPCDCCSFEQCYNATCKHPYHQMKSWEEHEGEHPEQRAMRRSIWESQITPVQLACLGIV